MVISNNLHAANEGSARCYDRERIKDSPQELSGGWFHVAPFLLLVAWMPRGRSGSEKKRGQQNKSCSGARNIPGSKIASVASLRDSDARASLIESCYKWCLLWCI